MIDLSLKLTTDEVRFVADSLAIMLNENKDQIEADEYAHYFNLKSLCIRFKKKTLRCSIPVKQPRRLKVRVNVNEFNSVKFLIGKFYNAQVNEGKEYWQFLFQYFIGELQTQMNATATIN